MSASLDRRLANLERRVFKPSLVDEYPELASWPEAVRVIESGTPEEQDQMLQEIQEELGRRRPGDVDRGGFNRRLVYPKVGVP
jgi:hypothetical protein